MCRLFGYAGNLAEADFEEAVTAFSKLARDGCVPCGESVGHLDGWGAHACSSGRCAYVREAGEADTATLLEALLPARTGPGKALIHLRKATVGGTSIANTHPFVRSGVAFGHNGSIHADFSASLTEGDTDSEQYFLRIMERTQGLGAQALAAAVDAVALELRSYDWTSLTCLLAAPDGLVLKFLWNADHPRTEAGKLNDYYTFFRGTKGDSVLLCSERLPVPGFSWEALPNDTTLVIEA